MIWYEDTLLWRLLRLIGIQDLRGEIIVRKFYLVYVHDAVAGAFLLLTAVSILWCVKHRGDVATFLRSAARMFLFLYVIIVGSCFFNSIGLTHNMFRWHLGDYLRSAAWSLVAAVAPVLIVFVDTLLRGKRSEAKKNLRIALALIPILHTAMALIYISFPLAFVE